MRIAVDVMGGDHAPDEILKGCVGSLPLLEDGDALILVGDRGVIEESLAERGIDDPRIEIEHASEVIAMEDSPAKAVRSKPDSSIVRLALRGSSRSEHPADAVISAGNTGACVTAAIMHMKRLRGVHRPGIAVTIPAFHGPVVLCDAGANPEPTAAHLWQYAVMADAYARHSVGLESPRVALMNIGAEEGKGSDLVREAARLIRATPGIRFTGYIEGRDFFAGAADVVVTDGFVGNTILKMAEGLAKSLFEAIAAEIMEQDPDLALRLDPIVRAIYAKNDYHEFGGAPLLGVNGRFMIAHGSSVARTITAAIRNTRRFVTSHTNEMIERRLHEVAAVV